MKNSPKNQDDSQRLPPSPSNIITITSFSQTGRSDFTPQTFSLIRDNPFSFKQIVQILTGPPMNLNPTPQPTTPPRYALPPLRPVHKRRQSSSSSSSSSSSPIYQRRNPKNHLKINPVRSGSTETPSPSVLNIQSLALGSPNTPLVASGELDVEQREIREKGFYLLPSPSSTPTDPKPELLVLFPLTSPRASDSSASST